MMALRRWVRTLQEASIAGVQAAAVFVVVTHSTEGTRLQDRAPSPPEIALGDSVYHGRVGGALCYVCHGPAAKGVTGIGPDLTDKEWLHGDGSRASIEKVVTEGVAKPKKLPAPMPARGGGQLSEPQVKAVAAYVYSLSHPAK